MSFLKNLSLIVGGAVAGFAVSKVASTPFSAENNSALLRKNPGTLAQTTNLEGTLSRFFDSPLGQRLQPYALKSMDFAGKVKRGMDEREAQLKNQFAEQKSDSRPGAVDEWQLPYTPQNSHPSRDVIDGDTQVAQQSSLGADSDSASATRARIARDETLGKDFFA